MTFLGESKEKLIHLQPVSVESAVEFLATRAKLSALEAKTQVHDQYCFLGIDGVWFAQAVYVWQPRDGSPVVAANGKVAWLCV